MGGPFEEISDFFERITFGVSVCDLPCQGCGECCVGSLTLPCGAVGLPRDGEGRGDGEGTARVESLKEGALKGSIEGRRRDSLLPCFHESPLEGP